MKLIKTILFSGIIFGLVTTTKASPRRLFLKGNRALAAGRYEEAVSMYQIATQEDPNSPEIQYNLANALYRLGNFSDAINAYEQAATLGEKGDLQSKAWYNMGNCLVKLSEKIPAQNPELSSQFIQQAQQLYKQALLSRPDFSDAKYNLNITTLLLNRLKKAIQKKKEEKQKHNHLIEEIRAILKELIKKQTQLIQTNQHDSQQQDLLNKTYDLVKKIKDSGLAKIPQLHTHLTPPLQPCLIHTQNAAKAMEGKNFGVALGELQAALQSLPDEQKTEGQDDEEEPSDEDNEMESNKQSYQDGKQNNDFSKYDELRGLPPPNRSEKDILDEEVRNNQRRKNNRTGKYKSVDKDW